jgi:hypothetical protein
MATNKELASKYRAMLHLKVRRGPEGPEVRDMPVRPDLVDMQAGPEVRPAPMERT